MFYKSINIFPFFAGNGNDVVMYELALQTALNNKNV